MAQIFAENKDKSMKYIYHRAHGVLREQPGAHRESKPTLSSVFSLYFSITL